jgi:hypothetical protein
MDGNMTPRHLKQLRDRLPFHFARGSSLIFLAGVNFFGQKNGKKLCFLSVFSLFLSLFLSFSVHTVWVLFSVIHFTKVSCEG